MGSFTDWVNAVFDLSPDDMDSAAKHIESQEKQKAPNQAVGVPLAPDLIPSDSEVQRDKGDLQKDKDFRDMRKRIGQGQNPIAPPSNEGGVVPRQLPKATKTPISPEIPDRTPAPTIDPSGVAQAPNAPESPDFSGMEKPLDGKGTVERNLGIEEIAKIIKNIQGRNIEDTNPPIVNLEDDLPHYRNEADANEMIGKVKDAAIQNHRLDLGPALSYLSDWTDSKYDLGAHYDAPKSPEDTLTNMMKIRDATIKHRNDAELGRAQKLIEVYKAQQAPYIAEFNTLANMANKGDASSSFLQGRMLDLKGKIDGIQSRIDMFNAGEQNKDRRQLAQQQMQEWQQITRSGDAFAMADFKARREEELARLRAELHNGNIGGRPSSEAKGMAKEMDIAENNTFATIFGKAIAPDKTMITNSDQVKIGALRSLASEIALHNTSGAQITPSSLKDAYWLLAQKWADTSPGGGREEIMKKLQGQVDMERPTMKKGKK